MTVGTGCCCRCRKRRRKDRVSPHGLLYKDFPHFVNQSGNYLFCRYWEPATEPRAMLMMIHGVGEHSGYYSDFTSIFTGISLSVFAHDHLGHGQSEGKRLTVPDFSIYICDCQQHIDTMRDRYPTLPLYLLSHSLGASITLNVVTKRPDIAGLIFIAPLVQMNPESVSASKMCCASILYHLIPTLTLGSLDPHWLSSSAEEVQKIMDDPLSSLGPYKIRFTIQVLNAVAKLKEIIPTITLPVLIAHGELDKLCSIKDSFLLYKNVASQDKTLKVGGRVREIMIQWEDGFHDRRDCVHNSPLTQLRFPCLAKMAIPLLITFCTLHRIFNHLEHFNEPLALSCKLPSI